MEDAYYCIECVKATGETSDYTALVAHSVSYIDYVVGFSKEEDARCALAKWVLCRYADDYYIESRERDPHKVLKHKLLLMMGAMMRGTVVAPMRTYRIVKKSREAILDFERRHEGLECEMKVYTDSGYAPFTEG